MMQEVLLEEIGENGITRLTLNRPNRRNALNEALIESLSEAFSRLGADARVRVIVLRGSAGTFCAGGDLEWMRAQFEADRDQRVEQAMALSGMLLAIDSCPKPVVAVAEGHVFGGGIGLLSVCDIAIAASDTKFALSETRLGLIPATISPFVAASIGPAACRDTWLSAEVFDATRAQQIGLIRGHYDKATLDEQCARICDHLLQASPAAVAEAKTLTRRFGPVIDESVLLATSNQLANLWESPDAQEGVEAFLEKRRPVWPSWSAG